MHPTTRLETASAYTRPASRAELVTEALTCIISGRPFPEQLRAPVATVSRPESVEAGLARTMAAPRLPIH